jgi:hypothetical protein
MSEARASSQSEQGFEIAALHAQLQLDGGEVGDGH